MRCGTSAGCFTVLLMAAVGLSAAEIRVAVASNFGAAARELESAFETDSGHQVKLAFGSTGKHYAQISNGAPMDVLLAADTRRPQRLESEGLAVPESRFTYASGRLVLWGRNADSVDPEGRVLAEGRFRHLAIANPRLAPYGAAAREVLQALGLWDDLQSQIVRGENVAQALQFVDSGNAELGFIAASQLTPERRARGSAWDVPQDLYSPIEQQAVLVRDVPAAREFLVFLRSDQAREIISRSGYEVPQ